MTNEERKVIELALEALETPWNAPYVDGCDLALGKREKAITAIKEALAQPEQDQDEVDIRSRLYQRIHELETQLAQPEQEPVAWIYESVCGNDFSTCIDPPSYAKNIRPLYTTPPQRTWVGLTDEEMEEIRKQAVDLFVQEVKTTGKGRNEPIKFGRLVEAKIKDKNL